MLCILYFVISAAIPHDRLESRGLEGIGKPSLKIKTEQVTDDTELTFSFVSDEDALQELSFYFTSEEPAMNRGQIRICVQDDASGELLAEKVFDLKELGEEAFWGVTFEQEPAGRKLTAVITGENVENGPYIWLNTESDTKGESRENGQLLEHNLIYNAVYKTQVHDVKKPALTTAMLAVFGGLCFFVSGRKEEKSGKDTEKETVRKQGGIPERLKKFFTRYRTLLGLGLLLAFVAVIFLYVYDVQIRKAMNSTHREVVMKDNNELLAVDALSKELEQYYTAEEDTLVGLGIRVDLSEDFAGEGMVEAEVTDVTSKEAEKLLCTAQIPASGLLDGQYMGLIFDESQSGIKGHTYRIRLRFSEELLGSGLSLYVTPEGYYPENSLYIDGEESENRLSMNAHTYFNLFLKKYFFGMFLFAEAAAAGFYYLTFMRRCRIEKVFLFTVLCLGVIYNFLLVPYMTPDSVLPYRYVLPPFQHSSGNRIGGRK